MKDHIILLFDGQIGRPECSFINVLPAKWVGRGVQSHCAISGISTSQMDIKGANEHFHNAVTLLILLLSPFLCPTDVRYSFSLHFSQNLKGEDGRRCNCSAHLNIQPASPLPSRFFWIKWGEFMAHSLLVHLVLGWFGRSATPLPQVPFFHCLFLVHLT